MRAFKVAQLNRHHSTPFHRNSHPVKMNESLGRGQIFVISGIHFSNENRTVSGINIYYKREFGLSSFIIKGLLCTLHLHTLLHYIEFSYCRREPGTQSICY